IRTDGAGIGQGQADLKAEMGGCIIQRKNLQRVVLLGDDDAGIIVNWRAARTIHLVSAVEGNGSAATRSTRPVTPDICAASVSLRLATRSSCRASPQTSSTTTPSASQASA